MKSSSSSKRSPPPPPSPSSPGFGSGHENVVRCSRFCSCPPPPRKCYCVFKHVDRRGLPLKRPIVNPRVVISNEKSSSVLSHVIYYFIYGRQFTTRENERSDLCERISCRDHPSVARKPHPISGGVLKTDNVSRKVVYSIRFAIPFDSSSWKRSVDHSSEKSKNSRFLSEPLLTRPSEEEETMRPSNSLTGDPKSTVLELLAHSLLSVERTLNIVTCKNIGRVVRLAFDDE